MARRIGPFILVAVALGAAALASPALAAQQIQPDEPPPQRLQVDPARPQPVDRNQFQIRDLSQLRPVIADGRERDPRLAVIDWTAALSDRRSEIFEYGGDATATTAVGSVSYLPEISRRSSAQVRPVHMPILLPRRPGTVSTRNGGEPGVMLITRADFYDASYFQDGVSVHVAGTRRINHRSPEAADAAGIGRGRGSDGVRVVTDEAGFTADFTRYGAAYTVTVECASASDPRCADADFVRNLVRRLVVAGGSPDGEG